MTMTAPVWLLDIDGVLNANKPGWGAAPRKTFCAGFTIRWAPALLDRIREVHRSGAVEIRWCSTWCGYPDQLAALARAFRLDLASSFGDRPMSKTWAELKAEAALAVLAAGRRLIWTDDDEIGAARRMFPELAAAEADGRALLIAPRANRGLQAEHLDLIMEFAAAAEPWIGEDAWARASEPNPEAATFTAEVVDPDLGSIVVCRMPDGHEVYGADSPR